MSDITGTKKIIVPVISPLSSWLTKMTAILGGISLFINVIVVFSSVIFRYAFHSPLEWAEEVARALMIALVFFGVATSSGKGGHIGIDLFLGLLPNSIRHYVVHGTRWILVCVSLGLVISSYNLVEITLEQTTETGMPLALFYVPVFIGATVMFIATLEHAFQEDKKIVLRSGIGVICLMVIGYSCQILLPDYTALPAVFMFICFILGIIAGIPIAFTLGLSAMVFFLSNPTLPFVFFAQQVSAGVDHFVLLAIPFFLLAGAAMEVNGMSSRLVEFIVRGMGKFKGGLNMTTVLSMAFFSGISGSKLADVAAVGGVLMPAVKRTKQSNEDAAGVFAASAIMAESIPPCVNLIVMGFVANISIGALFIAGIVPAACLLIILLITANIFGKRINVADAYPVLMPRKQLIIGATVGLLMILMIGRGVVAGIATSTEISAFAVVYAIVVGRIAFRELTLKATIKLFIDMSAMSGMLLFIVASATSLSYALTIEMIPQKCADILVSIGNNHGAWLFLLVSIIILIIFGSVLEGAPALIIFAPILVPIAIQLGFHPLHYGIVMVFAMGFGLFSPPIGLGLYATCTICGVTMKDVMRPMLKYQLVIFTGIILVALFPMVTTWLPNIMGY
ncbi:C4-dicarboxylate ABC transporter permease [Gilliamella sp. wkB178]|uniref:TRAP transporter large permease n=1 Tax=Gilliamella sp. wkB178 TaxID=3120259 RepID=UPI00080DE35C|nr:TRAP transporter large permease subunit [Gilliamella apicola]OCG10329.1 C4-dicarboxylate ABC transporter permease [Gilliamella apicola]